MIDDKAKSGGEDPLQTPEGRYTDKDRYEDLMSFREGLYQLVSYYLRSEDDLCRNYNEFYEGFCKHEKKYLSFGIKDQECEEILASLRTKFNKIKRRLERLSDVHKKTNNGEYGQTALKTLKEKIEEVRGNVVRRHEREPQYLYSNSYELDKFQALYSLIGIKDQEYENIFAFLKANLDEYIKKVRENPNFTSNERGGFTDDHLQLDPYRNRLRGILSWLSGLRGGKRAEWGYIYDNFGEFSNLVKDYFTFSKRDETCEDILAFLKSELDEKERRIENPIRNADEEQLYREIVGLNSYVREQGWHYTLGGNPSDIVKVDGYLSKLETLGVKDPDILAIMDNLTADIKQVIERDRGLEAAKLYQERLNALGVGIEPEQPERQLV